MSASSLIVGKQILDFEWRFSIITSSSYGDKTNDCLMFLKFKLQNPEGIVSFLNLELSLADFNKLMNDIETIKNYVEVIS